MGKIWQKECEASLVVRKHDDQISSTDQEREWEVGPGYTNSEPTLRNVLSLARLHLLLEPITDPNSVMNWEPSVQTQEPLWVISH